VEHNRQHHHNKLPCNRSEYTGRRRVRFAGFFRQQHDYEPRSFGEGLGNPGEFGRGAPGIFCHWARGWGREIWPLRIEVDGMPGRKSYAVLPGIRQVSVKRLVNFIGFVSPDIMRRVDEALALYLND